MSFLQTLLDKISSYQSSQNNSDSANSQFLGELTNLIQSNISTENTSSPVNTKLTKLELFRNLLNESEDVIQVMDISGKRIFINQKAAEIYSISADKASDADLETFQTSFYSNSESWEKHLAKIRKQNPYHFEDGILNQSTKSKYIGEFREKVVELEGQEFILSTLRDVTEKKEHIKIIRLQEKKYRNIISNINLGLLELDNNDRILFCNSAFEKMVGSNSKQLFGKKLDEIITINSTTLVEDMSQHDDHESYKLEIKNQEDSTFWWLMSSVANYSETGYKVGTLRIFMDITVKEKMEIELKKAYQDAKDAAVAKETFLANMSHEIRTPLNAILGMIREVGRESITDKQKHHLKQADSAANHLTSLINSVLDLSKIDAGKLQLDEEEFSLHSFVQNIESILYTKAESKNIDFKFTIDSEIEPVHIGDEPRLRQIFINLIDNAIKFTEDGKVTVHVESINKTKHIQKVKFTVKDTGIGMDSAYLNDIFTKYSQESTNTSRHYGGTGLGMPITRELIHLMGGNMDIQSEKGKGTEISIVLFLPIGAIENLRKESSVVDKNSLQNIKVLLVDDNEMNRYIALQSLHFFGCHVVEAENGQLAIDALKSTDFDVIFMDIQMPVLDGIAATKIIRDEMKSNIPIIALTANAFKEDTKHYLEIGMNGYVTKPYKEEMLYSEIKAVLNQEQVQ